MASVRAEVEEMQVHPLPPSPASPRLFVQLSPTRDTQGLTKGPGYMQARYAHDGAWQGQTAEVTVPAISIPALAL